MRETSATLLATIMVGAAIVVLLLLLSIVHPRLRVWPLPDETGAALRLRRGANRLMGLLVSSLSAGVLLLAVLEPRTLPVSSRAFSAAGGGVFIVGAALGLLGYLRLGPALSHGQAGPLVSTGPYRFSRNPQYVGAIAVLLGFSAALGSAQALLAASACSVWFVLAPIAEESWLQAKFGSGYDAYLASAPRYLGLPRRRRSP